MTSTEKIYNPAEHRQPPGSGRASGTFAPGRVTSGSGNQNNQGTGGGGGGARGGGGGGSGSSSAPPSEGRAESAFDAHAHAMAEMDLQAAARLEANIANLKATLSNLQQEIKFWSQPFKPSATAGSQVSSGGAASGSGTAHGSNPKAGPGSTVSSGSSSSSSQQFPTFQAFLQNMKDQARAVEEHIDDLQAQISSLRQRAAEWLEEAKSAMPDATKEEQEIVMTAAQLRVLMDSLTSMKKW